jgi:hypothetical protein
MTNLTDTASRHIGPMAQDFDSTFSIGTDGKHIAAVDQGGVAPAAIPGLNQKVDSEKHRVARREPGFEATSRCAGKSHSQPKIKFRVTHQ